MSITIIAPRRPSNLREWLGMIPRDDHGRPLEDAELPSLPEAFVPSWARTYTQYIEGDELTIVFTGRTRRAKNVAGAAAVTMMGYWTLSNSMWQEHAPEVLLDFEDEFTDPTRLMAVAGAAGRAAADLREAAEWFVVRHPELASTYDGQGA